MDNQALIKDLKRVAEEGRRFKRHAMPIALTHSEMESIIEALSNASNQRGLLLAFANYWNKKRDMTDWPINDYEVEEFLNQQ
jgi:hypothetical protein